MIRKPRRSATNSYVSDTIKLDRRNCRRRNLEQHNSAIIDYQVMKFEYRCRLKSLSEPKFKRLFLYLMRRDDKVCADNLMTAVLNAPNEIGCMFVRQPGAIR